MLDQTVDPRTEAIEILNQKIEDVCELISGSEHTIELELCFDGKSSAKSVRVLKEQKVRLSDLLDILEILDEEGFPKYLRKTALL